MDCSARSQCLINLLIFLITYLIFPYCAIHLLSETSRRSIFVSADSRFSGKEVNQGHVLYELKAQYSYICNNRHTHQGENYCKEDAWFPLGHYNIQLKRNYEIYKENVYRNVDRSILMTANIQSNLESKNIDLLVIRLTIQKLMTFGESNTSDDPIILMTCVPLKLFSTLKGFKGSYQINLSSNDIPIGFHYTNILDVDSILTIDDDIRMIKPQEAVGVVWPPLVNKDDVRQKKNQGNSQSFFQKYWWVILLAIMGAVYVSSDQRFSENGNGASSDDPTRCATNNSR